MTIEGLIAAQPAELAGGKKPKRKRGDEEGKQSAQSAAAPAVAVVPTLTAPVPPRGSVRLFLDGATLVCQGETFTVKDTLKSSGGIWEREERGWVFLTPESQAAVLAFLGVDKPAPGKEISVDLASVRRKPPPPPSVPGEEFAMAGTIVVRLAPGSQTIFVLGHTGHIAERLRAAGGQNFFGDTWEFPGPARQSAKVFLCMDSIPAEYAEVRTASPR